MEIHSPYEYPCSQCTRLVDERREVIWSQVIGWEKKREAGGTNHVALRRPQNLFMCDDCMTKLQQGVSPDQQTLLSVV